MTGTDLRSALDEELRDLEPMPSVVPEVLAEGGRRDRRRRRSAVILTAAAVAALVATPMAWSGLLDSPAPERETTTAVPPQTDTRAEFARWAAPRFDQALPERFGDVRTTEHNDYVTHVDGTRVMFNMNISFVNWKHSDVEPGEIDLDPSCGGRGADSCTSLPRLNAIAFHDVIDGGYASLEMNVTGRYDGADEVVLNFFSSRDATPLPLSDEEILDIAESPQFDAIVEEYTAHPGWPYSSTYATVDPVRDSNRYSGYSAPEDDPAGEVTRRD